VTDAPKRRVSLLRKCGRVLGWLAFLWVAWSLRSAWPEIEKSLRHLNWSVFLAGIGLLLVSAYVSGIWFARVVSMFFPGRLSLRALLHLFFASQVLRHLPGRVWGISYQVTQTRNSVGLKEWLVVNIVFTVSSVYFGFAGAFIVWVSTFDLMSTLLSVLAAVLIYAAGWSRWPWHLLSRGARFVSRRASSGIDTTMASLPTKRWLFSLEFFGLGVAVWGSYVLGWVFMGRAFDPSVGSFQVLELWARYLIAWLLGYVSVLTPSGMGVREASFSLLSGDFPKALVAYYLIMARFALLFCDLILGLVFLGRGSFEASHPAEREVL
jgi:hypothetical protein